MSAQSSSGRMEFEVSLGRAAKGGRLDPSTPFNLVVLGDFSGGTNRAAREPIGQRRLWHVDCDNFEKILPKLGASLRLLLSQQSGDVLQLGFESLDDLHPDRLLKQAAPLTVLLEQRSRLLNPSTATSAAAEVQKLLATPPPLEPAQTQAPAAAESDGDTLARLLGGQPRPATPPATSKSGAAVDRLIKEIVAPSIVPGTTAQQTAMLSALDLELTHRLRSLLCHPEFQALESAWRGLDLLVRGFGGEENIKLFLLDVSKEELAADLQAPEGIDASGLARLVRREAEDRPWAVCLGQFTFGPEAKDLELLGRLARLFANIGAPFLAEASSRFVGCDSFGTTADPDDWKQPPPAEIREAWRALRELPETAYLGLALPRFLMRQPYGSGSDPIEAFPFEEMPAEPPHEAYLWGNPAILCGYLLAQAFQAEGWGMRAVGAGEVEDLPMHRYKQDGETKVKPCAEAWLSERGGDVIARAGLMALLSVKGRNSLRLANMQSVHAPPSALAGRWQ